MPIVCRSKYNTLEDWQFAQSNKSTAQQVGLFTAFGPNWSTHLITNKAVREVNYKDLCV